jgi:hypothetical protein
LRPFRANDGNIRENALDYEVVQEQAAALGRLGRGLEAALRNLSAHDASNDASDGVSGTVLTRHAPSSQEVRTRLIEDASCALWCFIVQREACGFRDQGVIVREYRVPAEVRNRLGVFPGKSRRPNR